MADITYNTGNGIFNYRVCGVIIHSGRILAMHDQRSPYYYLPGGRVTFGEAAEDAVIRELREELGMEFCISRPLWLNQGFFTEDVSGERYHEVCLYFLMDISGTELLNFGDRFEHNEGSRVHVFEWLPFERLEGEYFYPNFIKKAIYALPDVLTLRTELE